MYRLLFFARWTVPLSRSRNSRHKPSRRQCRTVSALIYLYFFVLLSSAYALTEPLITDSLPRGLVVVAGVPAAEAQAVSEKLHSHDRYLIQCLARDGSESAALHSAISTHALAGKIHVKTLTGKHLPFSDNMVNGLILGETSPALFNAAEITRVLAPNGVAVVQGASHLRAQELDNGWHKFIKPWPDGMDSWTHFAYDASGSMPGLLVHDGVLILALPDTITAFHADTGMQLWQQKTPTSDYRSPTRVFVVDGLVWMAASGMAEERKGAARNRTGHLQRIRLSYRRVERPD